jgi:ribosomal protein L10
VRTTLTLDEDVTKLLRGEMRRSGASLKAVVNRLLRIGLTNSRKAPNTPFVVHPRPLGLPPGLSYDNVEELLEALEGPTHK